MALDSARGIVIFGTSETGGRIGRAGTGETSGTGETGETGREFWIVNFELGTSCKLAPAGGKEGFDNDTNTNNLAEKFNTCN